MTWGRDRNERRADPRPARDGRGHPPPAGLPSRHERRCDRGGWRGHRLDDGDSAGRIRPSGPDVVRAARGGVDVRGGGGAVVALPHRARGAGRRLGAGFAAGVRGVGGRPARERGAAGRGAARGGPAGRLRAVDRPGGRDHRRAPGRTGPAPADRHAGPSAPARTALGGGGRNDRAPAGRAPPGRAVRRQLHRHGRTRPRTRPRSTARARPVGGGREPGHQRLVHRGGARRRGDHLLHAPAVRAAARRHRPGGRLEPRPRPGDGHADHRAVCADPTRDRERPRPGTPGGTAPGPGLGGTGRA
ncbi:hypothetical protein DWB77_01428 [Streptomyces hundungensis]|uniref:Uncharacterized protein n=1 Tax=Streptomyces hundungensis TaxID=1077946 RepID=A0A387H6A0_9ACTN|nr:hypothetical protein DWB77_01428 [Streptomyces hundungensis]